MDKRSVDKDEGRLDSPESFHPSRHNMQSEKKAAGGFLIMPDADESHNSARKPGRADTLKGRDRSLTRDIKEVFGSPMKSQVELAPIPGRKPMKPDEMDNLSNHI